MYILLFYAICKVQSRICVIQSFFDTGIPIMYIVHSTVPPCIREDYTLCKQNMYWFNTEYLFNSRQSYMLWTMYILHSTGSTIQKVHQKYMYVFQNTGQENNDPNVIPTTFFIVLCTQLRPIFCVSSERGKTHDKYDRADAIGTANTGTRTRQISFSTQKAPS